MSYSVTNYLFKVGLSVANDLTDKHHAPPLRMPVIYFANMLILSPIIGTILAALIFRNMPDRMKDAMIIAVLNIIVYVAPVSVIISVCWPGMGIIITILSACIGLLGSYGSARYIIHKKWSQL